MALNVVNNIKISMNRVFCLNQRRWYSVPQYLVNTPDLKLNKLSSGARVVTGESGGELATLAVYLGSGSANESDSNNGVTNFFQKLAVLGTSKKPKSQLIKEIEGMGVSISLKTDRERSAIVAQAHKQDIPKVVELLADFLHNNTWKQEDIEATRSSILHDLEAAKETTNMNILIDHIHAAGYQGTSYANTPLGEASIVKAIDAAALSKFQSENVVGQNILLFGTGAVSHEQLVQLAEKAFGGLPDVSATPAPPFLDFVGSEIRIRDDTAHLARAAFAFETVGLKHPLYWPSKLLKVLVGSYNWNSAKDLFASSRLTETTGLEKLGSVMQSFYLPYKQTGLFGVYVETTEAKLEDLTYEIFNEFQKLASYISPQELVRAKNQLKRQLVVSLSTPQGLGEHVAESVFNLGRSVSIAEHFKRIDEVSSEDITSLLTTYLTDVDPVVVGHGNIEELPDYNVMRSWTYWNRW